jgi:protein O-GlcNAc transferase
MARPKRSSSSARHGAFAFIEYQSGRHVTELLMRLDRAFAAFGLQAKDYCIFLPRLDRQRFLAAVGHSDVVLDSIGWSGCNSSLESLPFDLPIVTLTGPLMRAVIALQFLR